MNAIHTEHWLRLSRLYAAELAPWFAPAIFACRLHQTTSVEVAAIATNLSIYFNPDFVRQIVEKNDRTTALAQLGYIWVHEISHILREHADRAGERVANPLLWNIACDLEINDHQWRGLIPPTDFPPILPSQFNFPEGWIAEQYYHRLQKNGTTTTDHSDEGSGVHGLTRHWEIGEQKNIGIDELQITQIRRQVAVLMKEEKGRGTMPAGWDRWADDQIKPRIDWRKVLRHRVNTALVQQFGGKMNYSYTRPSRRQTQQLPFILPALNMDYNGHLACVIDTSGSMSSQDIGQAVAEVMRILETYQMPVTVIPCDAQAYQTISVRKSSDRSKLLQLPGGGGTSMTAGIMAATQLKQKPDIIVVLTDGFTDYPPQPLHIPVIFGIIHQNAGHTPPLPPMPPWPSTCVVDIIPGRAMPC
jgi:predicted metal-dependent peptidase